MSFRRGVDSRISRTVSLKKHGIQRIKDGSSLAWDFPACDPFCHSPFDPHSMDHSFTHQTLHCLKRPFAQGGSIYLWSLSLSL